MLPLATKINPSDETFRANRDRMQTLVQQLRDRLSVVRQGGGPKYLQRHRDQGKLPVRERIELLLDPGSPLLELSPLAAFDMYDNDAPGAGIVTGVGRVSGREVLIVANDATVKGGTYYPMTVKKHLRAQQVALDNRLPCVYLVDSGGAFLPLQSEIFTPGGKIFYNEAVMSAAGIAQVAVVHGRRRVRARDVGRNNHRQRHRHDLSRRSAARESRDWRGSYRRRARRGRRPHAHIGRRGLPR